MTNTFPITEQENPRAAGLDRFSAIEIVRLMNAEDATVAEAVGRVLPDIALAVEGVVERIKSGGRLFYVGTGTSGRLGVLDASECPPTFGVPPELVQGIIAGGYDACHMAVEASEDDRAAGARDLQMRGVGARDAVVGIAASGRTPYTIGALEEAGRSGALTVALACTPDSPLARVAEIAIAPIVGPEVIAGSTRLKAGTAQKMVLNMLSTATMVRLGFVTGNRMTNLNAGNEKLRARALRILQAETNLGGDEAARLLENAGGDLRVALVAHEAGCSADEARDALAARRWVVRDAVNALISAAEKK
jgi:N-acetylmuramic acid 6-phosphate etherase